MTRTSSIALLIVCLVSVVLGTRPAVALEQWQQVPGTAVWVSIPKGWTATGHRTKHALLFQNAGASDTFLVAERSKGRRLKSLVQDLQKQWLAQYPGLRWRATDDGGWTAATAEGQHHLLLHAKQVKGWNVAIRSTTLVATTGAFSALHSTLLQGLHVGWKRPKPTWMTVPGTGFEVRHPPGDWMLRSVDNATIHWSPEMGVGTIQVGRFPSGGGDLHSAIGYVTRGMSSGEGQWTWTAATAWKVPLRKRKGLFRRGEATLRRNRKDVVYRMDAFAFLEGKTLIVFLSTSNGAANAPVSADLRKLAKSLRKDRR